MVYHEGTGSAYKIGGSDELSNYTQLINYKGKDKRFVYAWNQANFTNGQESSSSYIEYSDHKREYFGSSGRLIGIVDRFGNTITFNYEDNTGNLSSITDTLKRVVKFSYVKGSDSDPYSADNVIIQVINGGNEVQKVVLTKGKVLANIPNGDYVEPLHVYIPVLTQISQQINDQNEEKTYFNYQHDVSLYSSYGYNYTALLKEVNYTNSSTKYEYEGVRRNISYYESVLEFRAKYRRDYTGATAYQQIGYTYTGDYAGNTPAQYPGALPDDFRYSTTSTVISSTASNGLRTTNTFDKDGRVLRAETVAANGERKITENTAFHGLFTQSPTRTTISEYAAQDSEATANRLYTETTYTDWGQVQSQTEPLTGDQFNNPGLKQHYTTSYQYEPAYRFLASVSRYQNETDSAPFTEFYTYTTEGRPATVTNALGEQTVYNYNYYNGTGGISQGTAEKFAQGQRVAKSVTIYGADSSYAYPTEQQQWFNIGTAEQKIVKTTMGYDIGSGRLVRQTDGNNQTTSYEYDGIGRLKKETLPEVTNAKGEKYSQVTDYSYTNMVSPNLDAVNAGTHTLKVDSIKTVTRIGTGNTQRTYANVLYNGLGLALLEERYDDSVGKWVFTQYHYDDLGQPVYMKDALDNETTASYDAWNRQNRSTDPYKNLYVTDFDLKQRKSTSYMLAGDTQEKLNYVETTYDPRGQVLSNRTYQDWPSQSVPILERYTYNISGSVTGYTDPMNHLNDNGVTTSYTYDALNRLTSVQDALNQTTRYGYDGNGQLTNVTIQGKGGTPQTLNTKSYDEVGLLTVKQDGASQKETRSYNALGQLTTSTDRNGSTFGYTYDERGQLKTGTVSGLINNVAQTQKTEQIAGDGTPQNQSIHTYTNGALTASQTLTLDSFNQVRKNYALSGNHSANILNTRDALGRMTQINDAYLGFYTNYQYVKTRLDKVQTNGSAALSSSASDNAQYSYNANGQVKLITYPTLTDGSLLKTEYTHNKALGWVESVQNTKSGGILSRYVYTYDRNGNISAVSETRNAVASTTGTAKTTTYGYDALNRLVSIARPDGGSTVYTYDVRGNRLTLSDSTSSTPTIIDTSYTYDLQNTLTSVTQGRSTSTFTYYADGLRYLKSTGTASTQVNYDFSGQVITEEKLNGGSIVQKSTYVRGDRVLVKKDKTASKDYYYLYNGHGDVVQIVDTTGKPVNSYEYDVWGNITTQTEGIANSFKYAGEVYDAETGLYYLRARYYDPSMGRFLNEDTYEGQVDNPLTQNLYTYVSNNPLIYSDPTGHFTDHGGSSGGNPLDHLSNTSATSQVISARSVDAATQAKILKSLMKEYKYGFYGDDSGGMTRNQFEYLYNLAMAKGLGNYDTAIWAISQLDNYFSYGKDDKTTTIALTIGAMGAGAVSGGSSNWKSSKQFGHSFLTHGAGAKNTRSLIDRARSTKNNQGQWLDNQKAADFITSKGPITEATTFDLPAGMGQVITPEGVIIPATKAIFVPSSTGIKTAYPIP
nr:RHS repeat-associated core domain-containing protein [Paenibacillus phytohabitans]